MGSFDHYLKKVWQLKNKPEEELTPKERQEIKRFNKKSQRMLKGLRK